MAGVCLVRLVPSDIQEKLCRLFNNLNTTLGCVYQVTEFEFYLEGGGQPSKECEEESGMILL